ncbi:nuclear protein Es2-domain-containing protein [Globomyces pollinis-pini]|nr:nuclear protein Es2-domain-containing protein [Globomyces pollinis-pini]
MQLQIRKPLVLENNNKVVLPTHLQPLPKSKPQEALEEDDYIDGISTIIQRDFFPDVKKLKLYNDYLEAKEKMDTGRIFQLRAELDNIVKGNQTSTPKTENPNLNTDLTLDKFQTKYTSEDNASFQEILNKNNEAKREKYHYLYQGENQTLALEYEKKKMVEFHGHASKPIITWEHKAKSALMYGPEGAPLTANDIHVSRAAPKEVVHSSTRFESLELKSTKEVTDGSNQAIERSHTQQVWSQMAQATPMLFSKGEEAGTPKVAGYSYVPATPDIRPEVDIDPSELMTWGMIESTPLLVEHNQNPNAPTFSMAPTPRREVLGHKLAEKASESLRKRQGAQTRFKTPLTRGMSPAVQRLAAAMKGTPSGFGNALRATYSTPKIKSTPSRTPQFATPMLKRTPKLSANDKSRLEKVMTSVDLKSKDMKDMTDDLLDF